MRLFTPRRLTGELRPHDRRKRNRCIPTVVTLEERSLLSLTIRIDYSQDNTHFFNTPLKKQIMQLAADSIAADITANLAAIKPGNGNSWITFVDQASLNFHASFTNPTIPANTIVVYALGRALPGTATSGEAGRGITGGFDQASGSPAWINLVQTRGLPNATGPSPHSFGTWGGAVIFDTNHTKWFFGQTMAGLKSDQTDFLSIAEHELGHVLGLGTADAWFSDVSAGQFIGATVKAKNGGKPAALDPNTGFQHWHSGTKSGGLPATMDPSLMAGTRAIFTSLDYAALNDIGWQVRSPVLQYASTQSASVHEGATSVTLNVARTGPLGPAAVQFSTVAGTAIAGVDFKATTGTLKFALGQTKASFSIPLLANAQLASNESFTVNLSNPNRFAVLGSNKSKTVNILAPTTMASTRSAHAHTRLHAVLHAIQKARARV